MARRGDIFDIFPSGYPRPVRMEFFGDTLEELRLFDAESQRSLQGLDELTLLPALPFVLDAQGLAAARKRMDALFAGRASARTTATPSRRPWMPAVWACCRAWCTKRPAPSRTGCPRSRSGSCPDRRTAMRPCTGRPCSCATSWKKMMRPCRSRPPCACAAACRICPGEKARRFYLEPLVMGVDAVGDDVQERPLHAFTDLFPVPGAADRPWRICLPV